MLSILGSFFWRTYSARSPLDCWIVKLKTGKDIREVESGRTGGTNAMRAAGFWAGFATAMLDILKARARFG
ncbi:MAG: glycerol-3-phosphate acyltransferase [Anaerolineales bacterium]|nr:glycerol-3-phosphate acyltransferase [Anaerolineales bacterium]